MLDFRDVPNYWTFRYPPTIKANQGRLPVSTVGKKLSIFSNAAIAISRAWKKWFAHWDANSPVDRLPISMIDLSASLSQAANSAMSYADCLTYANLYLRQTAGSANLATKAFVANLPPYHRRALDELLGVGLSFAVARYHGYIAFAAKPDYDNLMGAFGVKWTRPWIGSDGPDVLALSSQGQFAFLEIKGRAKVCARTPVDFGKFKAQSLNAHLGPVPTRHLLSYAYLPCGTLNDNALVRWFNAATNDAEKAGDDSVYQPEQEAAQMLAELAVAYCHYQTIIRNTGRAMPPSHFGDDSDDWLWDLNNKAWIEAGPRNTPRLLVPQNTAMLFNNIENYFVDVRNNSESNLPLARLELLHFFWRYVRTIDELRFDELDVSFRIVYRYGNGACVMFET